MVLSLLVLFVSTSFLGNSSFQSSSYRRQSEAQLNLSVGGANMTHITKKSPLAFKIEFFTDAALTHRIRNGRAVEGSTLYLDIILINAHRNPVNYSGSPQLQVTLSISAGALSATNVWISPGHSDTESSFGGIIWLLPSSAGLRISINCSAIYDGRIIFGEASLTTVRHR